ncbi:oxygen-dependent tRNA uridine(34) hydroxylase TrhO [Brevundimonas goettingensis]|uniref:tRNA uridine(34) hydroxylase n=1 Tax=Brevundimonas goettingensis TaxID=2774190 RepID=A0A975GYU2_9CAUL|nr:rhodanese-related sulfurtransferase [Brevundimonas goettingensis]QTC91960.1 rhodanese-related sulfurtransferase [Brevundimonas goettingensis]
MISPPAPFQVAALYRFARIEDREAVRDGLEAVCAANGVRGTLLVAHEGLNGTIAGTEAGIAEVIAAIHALPGFDRLELKYSTASEPPFLRLKVRIKAEIVTMGEPDLDPATDAGTYVSAQDWNALIADPATIVIDTRNDYEAAVGAFQGAIQPNTKSFRDFPDWVRGEGRALFEGGRLKTGGPPKVAMYCTGGIRCEKATAFLKAEGIDDVHHLEGGILRYLEDIPEAESLWRGECFVFDERVAVGHGLEEGTHSLCRGCRMPVSPEGRLSPLYVEGVSCEACHQDRTEEQRAAYAERHRQVGIASGQGVAHIGADAAVNLKRSL